MYGKPGMMNTHMSNYAFSFVCCPKLLLSIASKMQGRIIINNENAHDKTLQHLHDRA